MDQNGAAVQFLLDTWERVARLEDLAAILDELERAASRHFQSPSRFHAIDCESGSSWIPILAAGRSEVVAFLETGRSISSPTDQLFCRMAGWAVARSQLLRVSRGQEEIVQSLRVALRILEESLPESKLSWRDWEISGLLRPALHLGGDLFSYSGRPERLRFLLADAVGHGLDSALLVSECRALWRGLTYEQDFPAEVSRLSQLLYENTGPERFVAAILGRCGKDGWVEFVACGQGPLFVLRKDQVELLGDPDLPLGLFPDQHFELRKVQLQPGEGLFCTTDGVLEWQNPSGEMFGTTGVIEAIQGQQLGCSQQILETVLQAMDHFHTPESARDDACAIALVRL